MERRGCTDAMFSAPRPPSAQQTLLSHQTSAERSAALTRPRVRAEENPRCVLVRAIGPELLRTLVSTSCPRQQRMCVRTLIAVEVCELIISLLFHWVSYVVGASSVSLALLGVRPPCWCLGVFGGARACAPTSAGPESQGCSHRAKRASRDGC